MNQNRRTKLRFGPYRTPRFKYGDVVFCERASEVRLCGLSKGRIPWPTCRRGTARAIVLYGALVDAVRRESSLAVQYWFGVGQDKAFVPVGELSGGERARLNFALVTHDAPALLILDEPTNHLDLASIEELEQALQAFDGALVVVSHDRAFLRNIGIARVGK